MGFKYGFQDGITYGAEDINNIVANFTTAGVNIFTNKDENNLNTLSLALTEAGVEGSASNSCKVEFDKNTSKLKILPGVAFFDDGSTITIDSSGVLLEPHRYVYLKKDLITNTGYPVSSDGAPGEHDIPLAEYQNGVLTDRRVFALSKIAGFGQRTYGTYFIEITTEPTNGEWVEGYTFEDADPYWKYVMIYDNDDNGKNFCGHGQMDDAFYTTACVYTDSNGNVIYFVGESNDLLLKYSYNMSTRIKFSNLENSTIKLYYKSDEPGFFKLKVRFA